MRLCFYNIAISISDYKSLEQILIVDYIMVLEQIIYYIDHHFIPWNGPADKNTDMEK